MIANLATEAITNLIAKTVTDTIVEVEDSLEEDDVRALVAGSEEAKTDIDEASSGNSWRRGSSSRQGE